MNNTPNRVKGVKKQTNNRFLNLYEFTAEHRDGKTTPYFVASRHEKQETLKALTHDKKPDGVAMVGIYGENKDKIVLVRQFRYPINDYIYELPAGLIEESEDMYEAAVREVYEETGLKYTPVRLDGIYTRPYYMTVGMTDECCGTVYGYCEGTPSNEHEEATEDIEIVIADREECRRILNEENCAMMCALMLMRFVSTDGDLLEKLK